MSRGYGKSEGYFYSDREPEDIVRESETMFVSLRIMLSEPF